MSRYDPLLPKSLVDELDQYIGQHISDDPDVVFTLNVQDILEHYPDGWRLRRIIRSLGLYMRLRSWKWDIDTRKDRHKNKRYILSKSTACRSEDSGPFAMDIAGLSVYLDPYLLDGQTIVISVRSLIQNGYRFHCEARQREEALRLFLGFHPEYAVIKTTVTVHQEYPRKERLYYLSRCTSEKSMEIATC